MADGVVVDAGNTAILSCFGVAMIMNFRVLKGKAPANADALARVVSRFSGHGTVFLEREGGGELLIANRITEDSSERLIMGLPRSWLENAEMAPALENAAVRLGVCSTAPR